MTLTGSDLGSIGDLATALGLVRGDGEFEDGWLSSPGDHLKTILADDTQRDALVAFVDTVLGGAERSSDADGLVWLPIVAHSGPDLTLFAVFDVQPEYVGIGVGASMTSMSAPAASARAYVPVFRAARRGHSVASPILLGQPGAAVHVSADITVDVGSPAPGEAHLGGIALDLRVPTAGEAPPRISLALRGLQLPGATQPTDLSLSLSDADELADSVLQLVLGLVKAQADALGTGPLRALADLIGLGGDGAIPPFPIQAVAQSGVQALASWFESIVNDPGARAAWLTALADLAGAGANVAGDVVHVPVGGADLELSIAVAPGPGGHPRVTPRLAATVAVNADVRVQAAVDLVTLDLGTGSATALPRLEVSAVAGHVSGGPALLTGDPACGAVRVGFGLDSARRPVFVLAADSVDIGTAHYDTLDLTSPDALADAVGSAVEVVLDHILGRLSADLAVALRVLLGLTAPPGHPAVPTIPAARLVSDPLGALREYWRVLLADHPDAVVAVLQPLRDLISDVTKATTDVSGTGTAADPWTIPLAGPVDLQLFTEGSILHVTIGARYVVDTLGQRCTRVESRLRIALVSLDLSAGHATFCSLVEARLAARARGADPAAQFRIGDTDIRADEVGLSARWSPVSGLAVDVLAPNLAVATEAGSVPLVLPRIGADGSVTLDPAGWDGVEQLVALLAPTPSAPWIANLVDALGWRFDAAEIPHRLRLADLVSDPEAALLGWFTALALEGRDALVLLLHALARAIGGTASAWGVVDGSGRPDDPYAVPLGPDSPGTPELAVWLLPDGPSRAPTAAALDVRDWRPGQPGLALVTLAGAIADEATIGTDVADLVSGRPDVAEGLDALLTRWSGTDGRIVPPSTDPAGITVHRLDDVPWSALAGAVSGAPGLASILGHAPAAVVMHVVVAAPAADVADLRPEIPAARRVDLRATGLAPASFEAPTAGDGEWLVLLGGRADCVLAAADPDGVTGQSARLRRVLGAFGPSTISVVASAEAGHAVLRAVADQFAAGEPLAAADVVTLGMPLGPVSFSIVDDQPAADTLRLLHRLLPGYDADDPDDGDLANGRALIDGLRAMSESDDPGRELRPPAGGIPAVPAGVGVHAAFGVVQGAATARGLTAAVVAGLAARARARAGAVSMPATGVRLGIRLPVTAAGGTVTAGGHVMLELGGLDLGSSGVTFTTDRSVISRLELRRAGGWLVGGPDPGRTPGPRPGHEVRWVAAEVTVPFGMPAAAAGTSRIVLHEARVFGLDRERWVVTADAAANAAAGLAATAADSVTSTLPEVRVLLSDVMAELQEAAAAAPATAIATAEQLLVSLGLTSAAGGSAPDALDHLLHDPATHVRAVLADPASRSGLSAAAAALLGGGISLDLAARAATVEVSGTPGALGLLPWTVTAHLVAGAAPDVTVAIGSPGATAAGGAVLHLTTAPQLAIVLDWHPAGSATPRAIPLWPSADVGALTSALACVLPAEIGRIGIGYLRDLDPDAQTVIDAVLDALGLLGLPAVDGARQVLSPAGLVADPIGWFAHAGSFGSAASGSGALSTVKVGAFLDALKPILGIGGGPGTWLLTTGVSVRAGARDGHLELAIDLDTAAFTPIDAATGLVVTVTSGLTLAPGAAPRPAIEIAVGPSGDTSGGAQAGAVHVRLDSAGVAVFLRPSTGADIPLYPNAAGLGGLATQAVQRALPLVLDAVADLAGQPGAGGDIGTAVAAAGDVLGIRQGGQFVGSRLSAWAADPVASLEAALLAPSPAALTALAAGLDGLLGAAGGAAPAGGGISLTVHQVTVGWLPNPLALTVSVDTDVPGIDHVASSVTLDATGLRTLDVMVGPAAILAGSATLRPFARFRVGAAPPGGRAVEVGLHGAGDTAVAGRWHLDGTGLELVAFDGFGPGVAALEGVTEDTDAQEVALALVGLLVDLVAGFALGTDAVQTVLAKNVGTGTVRQVLAGPVLQTGGGDAALVAGLFDPALALDRLLKVAANLAATKPNVTIDELLRIGLTAEGGRAGVTVGIAGRVALGGDDVIVWLEADTRWVQRPDSAVVTPGLSLFVLDTSGATPVIDPGLEMGGVGIRVGRDSGPLLDLGVTLGSVAIHGYGHIGAGENGAGVQLQLSDLAVGVGGAGNGANPVAEGVLRDSGSGGSRLAPSFSPAVAVQKHGANPVLVSLSAGEGTGPWWLSIQKGFGPVYIEQVGLGVTVQQSQLQRISLLLDGRVSLFGLTASVDDLQLFYAVPGGGSFVDPRHWGVDLAGFAFSADLAGVTLEGGLRKFTDGANVEYVGMLIGRFAAYGLSVYGGYGTGIAPDGTSYASFFAFGAVNGPIGGPPAFFLTGIGGGLGINRGLAIPTDLSTFGDFVFLKALDPAARPSGDPMQQLVAVRDAFPMRHGEIWFAAGISFTSFALVDGIAVVSVAIGDGLEISLLGLARMALPRPELALVSIELGLVVRFSSKEGVLWIQAQLTDNSWLLHESVRLTGGFAFVTWYKGQYAGQFVLTMGGYHPHFHRDGYPEVPRLGFRWAVGSSICIKGENYFALTSEAVMAGGRLEASADFGSAWAHIVFGADGIVYFDPFRFELDIYARISAGVTIDVWIGEITISISIGAELHLEGPKFRGKARFSVGPVGITVPFGDTAQSAKDYLDWTQFLHKYLEEADPGRARAISAITGKGTRAPGTDGDKQSGTADGSAEKPYVVYPEFELLVKTTIPSTALVAGGVEKAHGGAIIGIPPMKVADAGTRLTLTLVDVNDGTHADQLGKLAAVVNTRGAFPVGVWGTPQPDDDRKVPTGDVITAIDGATFTATASITGTLPTPVNYFQVEVGPRKPLPFVIESAQRTSFLTSASELTSLVTDVPVADQLATARSWLARGGASRISVAAMGSDRAAPPLLGSLGEGFVRHTAGPVEKQVVTTPIEPTVDLLVHRPRAIGLLTVDIAAPAVASARTTVSQSPDTPRVAPPDFTTLRARTGLAAPARLQRQTPAVLGAETTLVSTAVPLTRAARGAGAAVSGRMGAGDSKARLDALTATLGQSPAGPQLAENAENADSPLQLLRPGEIAVLQMPNAAFDSDPDQPRPQLLVRGGPARVVSLAHGGAVLADDATSDSATPDNAPPDNAVAVPRGTERLVVLTGNPGGGESGGVAGWHSGQQLAYVGWSTALAPGATVHAEGTSVRRTRDRFRTGWIPGAELIDAATLVTTRFLEPPAAVAVLLDDPLGTEAARGIGLSLTGASRGLDPAGAPVPPTVVTLGNRSALVYAVIADASGRPDGRSDGVSVGVASQSGWHLTGMVGSAAGVGDLVDRLTRHGVDAIVRPLIGPGNDLVALDWAQSSAVLPVPVPAPPKKRARQTTRKRVP
jgi:large repetitive protein